jgi:peroxiredoxin
MARDQLCTRLDVPVTLISGRATKLGDFCGQKLVVFFCSADEAKAAAEIAAYEALAHEFEHAGAWVVGVVGEGFHARHGPLADIHISLGIDPDGAAFRRLMRNLAWGVEADRAEGATFVIGRDGGVDQAWPRGGHAAEALEAARERP